jgi:hypothetical protein
LSIKRRDFFDKPPFDLNENQFTEGLSCADKFCRESVIPRDPTAEAVALRVSTSGYRPSLKMTRAGR